MIRCTPTNVISPTEQVDLNGNLLSSNFLNQTHHMEMFGSHFKVVGNGLEDSAQATPVMNYDLDSGAQKVQSA